MKGNLLALSVSTAICLALAYFIVPPLLGARAPEGAEFASLADLRQSITERDERDVKPDRSVSFRSIIKPHPSDYIIYELQPNLSVRFQGVPVVTNSHGMRSPERAFAKPEGVVRIALLGDSFAFGWGVEQEKIFAAVMEERLNRDLGGEGSVEVLNFGVPGYSTFQEVEQFLEWGVKFEPDIVLVFFVDNDFGLPFFIRSLDDSKEITTVNRFQAMRDQQTDKEERAKTSDYLDSINPNRRLKVLAEEMEKKNVPVYLTINPRRDVAKDEQGLWVLKSGTNLQYVSIRDEFVQIVRERGLTPEEITLPDDPHPNAVRHEIYGNLIADFLRPAVISAARKKTPS